MLNHSFANAQTKPSSLRIHFGMLIKSSKVHEQFAKIFLLDTNPSVLDLNSELDELIITWQTCYRVNWQLWHRYAVLSNSLGLVLIVSIDVGIKINFWGNTECSYLSGNPLYGI